MAENFRRELIEKLDGNLRLSEKELLNIILSNAYGGRDMSAVADALLTRFAGVKAIAEAEYAQIIAVEGVTEGVATYLKTLGRIDSLPVSGFNIRGYDDFLKIASGRLMSKENEIIEVYLVAKGGKVIDIRSFTSDRSDRVDVSASEIMVAVSSGNARELYMAHNHVNCAVEPSVADDNMTARIKSACAMCNVRFCDHTIINSAGEVFSYRQSGRLEKI